MILSRQAINSIEDNLLRYVFDPAGCASAIDQIVKHTNSRGAAILPLQGRVPGLPISSSCEELMVAYFKEGWADRDHRLKGLPKLLGTGILVDQDISTPDFMSSDPYYTDFLGKYKFKWFAGINVKAGEDIWCLTLQRSEQQGFFTPHEQAVVLRLSASLERAAEFARTFGEARFNGIIDTLNTLSVGAMLVNRLGRIVHVNSQAERFIGSQLDIRQGHLRVIEDRRATALVQDHIKAALWSDIEPDDQRLAPVTIDYRGEPSLLLSAQPLRSCGLDFFRGARAVVTVKDLRKAPHVAQQILENTFGLTAREIELCQSLIMGHSVQASADRLRISTHTARTHLKRIMAKTGTTRQAELIIMLGRHSDLGK